MKISGFIKSEKECLEFLSQFDIHDEVFDKVMCYAKFFSDNNIVYRAKIREGFWMPELEVYSNSHQKYVLSFLSVDGVDLLFSDGFLRFEKLEYDSKIKDISTIRGYISNDGDDKLTFVLNLWAWG